MHTKRDRRHEVAVRSSKSYPAAAVLRGTHRSGESLERLRKLNGIHVPRTMLSHRSILISPLHVPIGESAFCHAPRLRLPPPARDRLLETSHTWPERRLSIGSYKGKCCSAQMRSGLRNKSMFPRRTYPSPPCPDDADHCHPAFIVEAPRYKNTSMVARKLRPPIRPAMGPGGRAAAPHTEPAYCNAGATIIADVCSGCSTVFESPSNVFFKAG